MALHLFITAFILLTQVSFTFSADDNDFVSLSDGKTMQGWHVSAKTGHSAASGNKSGGKWTIEDGAFVGTQDIPGNGGIIVSDQQFSDFEVVFEMKNDFGPDSGLFLRSTEDGRCYQAMIDYHANGTLMGVYGEGIGGQPDVRNFSFFDTVDKIKLVDAPTPLPVLVESWPKFWRHGEWNELRARIVNNPPTITTWINGVKIMEFTDTEKRHQDKGRIGFQVHGGGDYTKQFVRYRNVRVKNLNRSAGVPPAIVEK